jgi:hypothetical protein
MESVERSRAEETCREESWKNGYVANAVVLLQGVGVPSISPRTFLIKEVIFSSPCLFSGITTFTSRTLTDWQKAGGKNLFPVNPKDVKNPSEIPYM